MKGNHFYLTLPSNTSSDHYGPQNPNNYRTKLDHGISLDPEHWEVGLTELCYSKSWHNVPPCPFYLEHPAAQNERGVEMYTHGEFGGATYLSSKHLVRDFHLTLRDALPDAMQQSVRVRHDELSNKAKFYLKKDYYVWMLTPLAKVLGLASTMAGRLTGPGGEVGYIVPGAMGLDAEATSNMRESAYTVDVDRLLPTIYVYSDLVEQQHVGDNYVQLLRSVDVPPWQDLGGGDVVTQEFKHVHYVNLQTGNFESVQIKLNDPRGKPVDFKHGNVTAKLHFRKKER